MIKIKDIVKEIKENNLDVERLINSYKDLFAGADHSIIDNNIDKVTSNPPVLSGENLSLLSKLSLHKFIIQKMNDGILPEELRELYNTDGIYRNPEGAMFLLFNQSTNEKINLKNNKVIAECESQGINEETIGLFKHLSGNRNSVYTNHNLKWHVANSEYMLGLDSEVSKAMWNDVSRMSLINISYESVNTSYVIGKDDSNHINIESELDIVYQNVVNHEMAHLIYYSRLKSDNPWLDKFKGKNNLSIEESFCDAYAILASLKSLSEKDMPVSEKNGLKESIIAERVNSRDELRHTDKALANGKIDYHLERLGRTPYLIYNNSTVLSNVLQRISVDSFKDISNESLFNLSMEVANLYSDPEENSNLVSKVMNGDNHLKEKYFFKILNDCIEKPVEDKEENIEHYEKMVISTGIKSFLENKDAFKENEIVSDFKSKVDKIGIISRKIFK